VVRWRMRPFIGVMMVLDFSHLLRSRQLRQTSSVPYRVVCRPKERTCLSPTTLLVLRQSG
jgi:hypothetical protein